MKLRSWLFVPGDDDRKLAKIADCGADIVILDLEDAVAPGRKASARERVVEFLGDASDNDGPALWVRVNPAASPESATDLERLVPARPAGLVLPKVDGVQDTADMDRRLTALEAQHAVATGSIRLAAIVTETVRGTASLASYSSHPQRLLALAWGAEDLAAELGATRNRDDAGHLSALFQHVRTRFRLAAAEAGLPALETIHPDYRDLVGLATTARNARAEGFAGMLAIHPDQIPVIHEAFTPTAEEIERAHRIIQAFRSGAGVVAVDGRMLDRPHLLQAQRVLEYAGNGG